MTNGVVEKWVLPIVALILVFSVFFSAGSKTSPTPEIVRVTSEWRGRALPGKPFSPMAVWLHRPTGRCFVAFTNSGAVETDPAVCGDGKELAK